jgi:hypothetical protein
LRTGISTRCRADDFQPSAATIWHRALRAARISRESDDFGWRADDLRTPSALGRHATIPAATIKHGVTLAPKIRIPNPLPNACG